MAGSRQTSPSPGWGRRASAWSPARPSAATTARGSPSHLPDDGATRIADVSGARACYCLWGPLAREILQPLTDDSLAREDFKFLRAKEITVGPVPVFAQRITFVGELGWELYCSAEYGQTLWDVLWAAGREHGMAAAGYRAIDSMRLEKGYRVWGLDITPETTPFEAGLSFAVRMDKDGGFIGRDALAAARATRRARCAASCSTTRSRSAWATSRYASAARRSAA